MNHPRTFFTAFLGLLVLATAAMVAINVVVDPFWRFDLVTLRGINGQRPVFSSFARSGKAGEVCRIRPAQVAIGTSRIEVGIDPQHPGWSDEPGPVYNLGLSGIGLKELSLTFQHVVNTSPLKRAVIGLDFLMFNANREAVVFGTEVLDFDESQLVLSRDGSCRRTFLQDANRLIGIRGFMYSAMTIAGQLGAADEADNDKELAWLSLYDRNGFRPYFPIGFNHILNRIGTRTAFSQEKYYIIKVWRPPPDERYCFTRPGQPNTFDVFRDMVRFARRFGVDVRFYLEPQHARMMLALQDAGLWPQFEDWKRGVVEILAKEAEESDKPQFPLWDFSGFNSITDEHIPDEGDNTTRTRWFWEGSHYRKAAGDLILDRLLNYHTSDVPADFGVRLSTENIESWLVATRKAGRDYIHAEPGEARFVQGVVESALDGSSGSNCGYYMDQLRAGSAALRRDDKVTAKADFERAKAIDENDRRRAADMGEAYWEPGFASALQTAEAGGELPPNLANWQAYQQRGIERDAAGDHLGAAADFAHAVRIGPPNTALHYLRGVALLHAGNAVGAAGEFERGLKLEPTNPTLAQLLQQARSVEKAN